MRESDLKNFRRKNGFTLIELLLGVGIAVMVLFSMYRLFTLGIHIARRAENTINIEAQRGLDFLGRDLRSAFLSGDKKATIPFSGTASSLQFLATLPLNSAGLKEYEFATLRYHLVVNPAGFSSLILSRRPWPETEGNPSSDITVADHIQSLRFDFYDGQSWKESWDDSESLPQAVRIQIELGTAGQKTTQKYVSVINIPCA
jgi:type II secretory pathway pseudopilin PulG